MDYESNIRNILLRYPRRGSDIKVFLDSSISGCDEDFLIDSNYISVKSPEDAEYIPVWIDFTKRCSGKILEYVEKYPNKCINVIHFIDAANAELEEITDTELESVCEMLSSPDWKSIQLGLSILRTYYMTDELKNLARVIIDTVQSNPMSNSAQIVPLGKKSEDAITIENLDIIVFYYVWLHNEILKI